MPLDKDTLYFIRLVSSGAGLGAAPVSDTADTAVTPGSWERIYRMAADHGLSAVVWDGIRRLPTAEPPPRETRIRWALSAEKLEERYRHQQQTASKLAARFSEEGLRMLLLKGLGLSRDTPSRSTGNAATSTFTSTANRTRATASCMRSGHTSISTSPSIRNTSGTGC